MDVSTSSKQPADNHGTRRNTRSTSNQDKEKENADSSKNITSGSNSNKDQESAMTDTPKKRQSEKVIRGQNGEVLEYTTEDDVTYRPMDSAYLATERPDNPYFICTIQEIKVSKRDNAIVVVKWYYRPTEVPDLVYQMLVKDRYNQVDEAIKDLILKPDVINRELFVADHEITDTYPISCLRGKCEISRYSSISEIKNFELRADHFFYIFQYNPETRRLASSKGETRVGPSHQWNASMRGMFQKAEIPDLLKPSERGYEGDRVYEEMTWEPKVNMCDLVMCLRAARSLAAFAGYCDGVMPEESCIVASRDDTTINALRVLFENNGNPRQAIDALAKNPVPVTIESKWTEEQVKRFQRGIRNHGKNFFRIRKELLPMKETGELVEFYYLWKKTQDSLMIRPHHRKHKRQATLKSSGKHRNNTNGSGDQTSTEEETEDSEESEKESNNYKCQHCLTLNSKDWLAGGKDGVMLCTDCRIFYKKYGENRPVIKVEDIESANETDLDTPPTAKSQLPPFLFKPIKEEKLNNLMPKKQVKSLAKVNVAPDIKKQNKRQWLECDDPKIKQEIIQTNLKRPKTEPSEIPADTHSQTNQEESSETSKLSEINNHGIIKTEPALVDAKNFAADNSSMISNKNNHSFVSISTSDNAHISSDRLATSSLKSSSSQHFNTSKASMPILTPFISTAQSFRLDERNTETELEAMSQIASKAGVVPRNVYPTIGYMRSGTPPTMQTTNQMTTSGQSTTTFSLSGTTTVTTTNTVRISPTVEQPGTISRTTESVARQQPWPDARPDGRGHHRTQDNPGYSGRMSPRSPRPRLAEGREKMIVDSAVQQRPPPGVHRGHGHDQSRGHHSAMDLAGHSGRLSPRSQSGDGRDKVAQYYGPTTGAMRFPFDPCINDQIISNANMSHPMVKEEPARGPSPTPRVSDPSRHLRPPHPHMGSSRTSPVPHIKQEQFSSHSERSQFSGHHRRTSDPSAILQHPKYRLHSQSPNPQGSHPPVHPSASQHPGRPPALVSPRNPHGGPSHPSSMQTTKQSDRDDSDIEVISDTRCPIPIRELVETGKSSRFFKIWNRGSNSCLRTDFIFSPDENSVQKRLQLQREHMKDKPQQQSQPVNNTGHEQARQPPHKRPRTPTHPQSQSEHDRRRIEKHDPVDRSRREGPGPLSSSSIPSQAHRSTPSHGNAPRSTPTRTPTTAYEQHPRPPGNFMSPIPTFGNDTPALRQLQQYASIDMRRNAAEAMSMHPLYPMYPPLAVAENEMRERELRERERLIKLTGADLKPEMLDPHNPNIQLLHSSGIPGLHMGGIPVSLAGQHLATMEQQLQLRQFQAQLLSSMPQNPAAAHQLAIAGFPPGAIAGNPFTPEAYAAERLSVERLEAERLAAEQYNLELLHHHQHSHVHSHLHLHGQPGGPPPPGAPIPIGALPHPPPDPLMHPFAAAMQSINPFAAASAGNPLLLNPAIRSQQQAAALMQQGVASAAHLHAAAAVAREPLGQPHPMSASQHLQAVHEQHIIERRAVAALQEQHQQQQYMAARLAGHKP